MFEGLFNSINVGIGAIGNATGIGAKSRQKALESAGAIEAEAKAAQSKTMIKILVVSGVLIFIILIIFLTLRKK